MLQPFTFPCSLALLVSTVLFGSGSVLPHGNSSIHKFPRCPLKKLPRSQCFSRISCYGLYLLLKYYFGRIGRIENPSPAPVVVRPRTPFISFCTVMLRNLCVARYLVTSFLPTTSCTRLVKLPGFRGSMVFRHAPIARKRSGNHNNKGLPSELFDVFFHRFVLSIKKGNSKYFVFKTQDMTARN